MKTGFFIKLMSTRFERKDPLASEMKQKKSILYILYFKKLILLGNKSTAPHFVIKIEFMQNPLDSVIASTQSSINKIIFMIPSA